MLYPKIRTMWARESVKPHRIQVGHFDNYTFEFLADNSWYATEKVDGTNVRVMWDGYKVSFGGRTDNAQMPIFLLDRLMDLFGGEANEQMFESTFGETPVTLFGEGFGGKIQKNNYGDVDFTLFDVRIRDFWLERDSVESVGHSLGINVVPVIVRGSLWEISDFVAEGFQSTYGDQRAEGLIAKPECELLNRDGSRVITKLKEKDFVHSV